VPLLDPLIERLQHTRIDRDNDIHRRIELFFGHPCFPCVRKAALHSGIAQAHHGDGKSDEHLFAVRQTRHRMGITIERPKIGFPHVLGPLDMRLESCVQSLVFVGLQTLEYEL
jgi:hypothetical protein